MASSRDTATCGARVQHRSIGNRAPPPGTGTGALSRTELAQAGAKLAAARTFYYLSVRIAPQQGSLCELPLQVLVEEAYDERQRLLGQHQLVVLLITRHENHQVPRAAPRHAPLVHHRHPRALQVPARASAITNAQVREHGLAGRGCACHRGATRYLDGRRTPWHGHGPQSPLPSRPPGRSLVPPRFAPAPEVPRQEKYARRVGDENAV